MYFLRISNFTSHNEKNLKFPKGGKSWISFLICCLDYIPQYATLLALNWQLAIELPLDHCFLKSWVLLEVTEDGMWKSKTNGSQGTSKDFWVLLLTERLTKYSLMDVPYLSFPLLFSPFSLWYFQFTLLHKWKVNPIQEETCFHFLNFSVRVLHLGVISSGACQRSYRDFLGIYFLKNIRLLQQQNKTN